MPPSLSSASASASASAVSSRYKPYPRYRDSGVEWLGEIPEHWNVARVGENAHLINGYPFDSARFDFTNGLPLVRIRDLQSQETEVRYAGPPIEEARIAEGDILIGMDGDFAVARWRGGEALLNQRLCSLRPKPSIAGNFLYYLLGTPLQLINDLTHSTTVKHLSSSQVTKTKFAFPPEREQRAIAEFLDRETVKIDKLIARKERLIELLEEKRTALVTHAVTRGLDPNVPLRDSGIEWLGQIPEHWEIRPLKRCGKVVGGTGFPHEYQGIEGEALPFYKVGDLGKSADGRTLVHSSDTVSLETAAELGADIIPAGAIVYAKIGAALLLNRRRLTTRPCCIDNNMSAFIPDGVIPDWSLYWLSILDFRELTNPGAVPSLSEGYQVTLPFAVPPAAEQQTIVDHLHSKNHELIKLRQQILSAIGRLTEYRAALITATVTGKIDVRNEVKAAA